MFLFLNTAHITRQGSRQSWQFHRVTHFCRTGIHRFSGTGGERHRGVSNTSAEPAKVAQADNTFAKESGATVDWRKFDSGASIVRALASGDVQIGNLGSSPLAVAASQQVPIEVFLLASKLGNSEALVVKKTISKPEDLIGKRIAVPFISTTHYSLLAALKHWGIKPGQVEIVNLQPPAIIAAWQRGDIDGAYVWAPAVNATGKKTARC